MTAIASIIAGWLLHALLLAPPEPTPSDARDPEVMAKASDLVWRGQAKFELSEYNAAIELWTAAYELLPATPAYEPNRQFLRRVIANTHKSAYGIDHDIQHLYKARDLLGEHFEGLDDDDEEGRTTIAAELETIAAMIATAELEQRAREQALAEAEASARAKAIEQTQREQAEQSARTALLRSKRDAQRRRVATGTGGALIGLGAASGGGMLAGLLLGQQVDQRGQQVAEDPVLAEEDRISELERLRARGFVYNGLALGMGIGSGVLLISGTALLVTARLARRPDRQARVQPGLGHLIIRF